MIDLILIIIIIVSLAKPDILLSKKMKEKANEEQKNILTKNLRKIYAIMVALFESLALMRYKETVGIILTIVFLILFFVISVPAIKENSKITKEFTNNMSPWAFHYCLIVSRRDKMDDMSNQLRGETEKDTGVKIMSYDRLVDYVELLHNGI